MKRFISVVLILLLLPSFQGYAQAVSTSASCAIVLDASSGRILYDQNIHERRLIASITKLMTALIAAERCVDLDTKIKVKSDWVGIEGSSIYLRANEVITMEELLYGLLLQSGNDAAVAIAGHIAGGIEPFATLMNEKAVELGMKNTHFTNPSGLNDEKHYSTAYDMALLACACLNNEIVAKICATQSVTVGNRTFYNHNKLLHRYDGCVGMKTGYTERAGRTLVSAAVRGEQTLVCVTLNDRNDWNDHEKLLNFGFDTYPGKILCQKGEVFGSVKIEGSLIPALTVVTVEQLVYPLKEGERLSASVELAHSLQAPVVDMMSVGWVTWKLDGKTVAETELFCVGSAAKNTIQQRRLWDLLRGTQRRATLAPNGAHLI